MVFAVGFLLLAQAILGPIGALAATIQTDLFIYQNGDTVTVTGNGFGGTETVGLVTMDPNATVVDQGAATTDGSGNFTYQFMLTVTVGGLYTVNANGQASGLTASAQFDPPKTTLTITDTPGIVTYGSSITVAGTLTDTTTPPGTPIAGAPIDVGMFQNAQCNSNQFTKFGSATTASNGTFSLSVLVPAGTPWLGANYAGVQQVHQAMSACGH